MTLRRKLLLFIPLLVLLTNGVTFFLFQSSKSVQHSYDIMMDRILLYTKSAQTAEANLHALYSYLLNPASAQEELLLKEQTLLLQVQDDLTGQLQATTQAEVLRSYIQLFHTLKEQEEAALAAASTGSQSAALVHYEQAEHTTSFIREEELHLIDLELSTYEPLYRTIQIEMARINWLGPSVFIVNTMLSIVLALWISRSITKPIARLVQTAWQISQGDLHASSGEQEPSEDELGLLSEAIQQMRVDLSELIGKDKQRLESERLVKELELQALQSQINPHFLFNTLNVLSKLALLEGADKTSDLIISLSNMMRYNLRKLDQPVPLREELIHVQEYLAIQKARFRNRVSVKLNVDEAALDALIPALTIQPLVENAFMHGIESMEEGAVLLIEVRMVAEGVCIVIQDNGIGMTEDVREALLGLQPLPAAQDQGALKASTGLGTRNVIKRLRLFYEREDIIDIHSERGYGTSVTILIPDCALTLKERSKPH